MTDKNKLSELHQMIETAQASLTAARHILSDLGVGEEHTAKIYDKAKKTGTASVEGDDKIIEGVFDGQHMVGPDGKRYSVPANYASKSKLVEGDRLKLTITADGSFIYKQIGPIDRNRLVGSLVSDETTGEYRVLAGNKTYKVLLASVTYFKGEPGDEIVILVPKDGDAAWAAVENVIKAPGAEGGTPSSAAVTPAASVLPAEDQIDDLQ